MPPEPDPGSRSSTLAPVGSEGTWRVPSIEAAIRRPRRAALGYPAAIRHDEWNVGIAAVPIAHFLADRPLPEVSWLPRRPGRYAADPFGLVHGGRDHILFEDYSHADGTGVISHVSIGNDGAWTEPEVVLEIDVHASYPFLIERPDAVYMVPETARAGEVALYRADAFPRGWGKVAVLLEDWPGSDTTIIEHGGRWWMFGTRRGPDEAAELYVWCAPELIGPWTPHRRNPVKVDPASARSAGTPFVCDGTLYRPAQDCSHGYGDRIVINRMVELTEARFTEVPVGVVEPDRAGTYPAGLHTISAIGDRTLLDSRRFVFSPDAFRRRLADRMRGFASAVAGAPER